MSKKSSEAAQIEVRPGVSLGDALRAFGKVDRKAVEKRVPKKAPKRKRK